MSWCDELAALYEKKRVKNPVTTQQIVEANYPRIPIGAARARKIFAAAFGVPATSWAARPPKPGYEKALPACGGFKYTIANYGGRLRLERD